MEIEVASVKPAGESGQGFGSGPQWGLASLVIGSVIFLASPVLLAFNTIFAHGGRYGVPMGLAWTASMIGWSALLILAGLNVWFGIHRLAACSAGRPTGRARRRGHADGWRGGTRLANRRD